MVRSERKIKSKAVASINDYEYEDEVLGIYGIDPDGNMDKREKKEYEMFMKSIKKGPRKN